MLGGYRKIYPLNDKELMEKYKKMLETSKEVYEFISGGGKKLKDG